MIFITDTECLSVMDCMWSSPIWSINYLSIYLSHHLPYMVKQRSSPQKYNHPLASSNIAHYVNRSEKCPNLT